MTKKSNLATLVILLFVLAMAFAFVLSFTQNALAEDTASYTIQLYKEKLNSDEYELFEQVVENATVGANVSISEPQGFQVIEHDGTVLFGEVLEDNSLVLVAYCARRSYTIDLSVDGPANSGTIENDAQETYEYEAEVTLKAVPNPGYTFVGWYDEFEDLISTDAEFVFNMGSSNLTYTAIFTEATDTKYYVKHYKQKIDNDEYEIADTDELSGTTNTQTQAQAKNYEGFLVQEFSQTTISPAGNAEVCIYYERLSFTLTLTTSGPTGCGSISQGASGSYKYGKALTLVAQTTPGYRFLGWYDEAELLIEEEATLEIVIPNHDLAIEARWEIRDDVAYTIEHYKQNADDDGYTIVTEDTTLAAGTTNTQTQAVAKTYTNYTVKPFYQATINGDESTVVKIYYDRAEFTLTLSTNDISGAGSITQGESGTYRFGKTITLVANTNLGYNFLGWFDSDNIQVGANPTLEFAMPTQNIAYEARWSIKTDVQYKVKHYKQNIDDDNYGEPEVDTLQGTTNTQTAAVAKSYTGFTVQEFSQQSIAGNGSTVVNIYYTRNSYALTLSTSPVKGGSITVGEAGAYRYQKEITITAQTNAGYTFLGWFDGETELTQELTYEFAMPTEALSYSALWEANDDTEYTVEHYKQNVDNEEFTIVSGDTQVLKGVTDTQTAAEAKVYAGFTPSSFEQVNINGNGSGVVKIYYTRNSYTLSLQTDPTRGGAITAGEAGEYKYEQSITITIETNDGYTFLGWFNGEDKLVETESYEFTMPAQNVTYTAKWSANDDTEYTVNHYKQNIDDDEYTLVSGDTQELTGTTDTQTAAEAKEYVGFTAVSFEQVNIDGNGSAIVNIYYTRNKYALTIAKNIANAGSVVAGESGEYKHGATITITAQTNVGYTFLGWYISNDEQTKDLSYEVVMPIGAVTYTATWNPNIDTEYTVEHYQQNIDDDEFTIVSSDTQELTGTTDTQTEIEPNSYDGFTPVAFDQITIKGDGSAVLQIYYTRNVYTIYYDEYLEDQTLQVKFGANYELQIPAFAGHVFDGWYLGNVELTKNDGISEKPYTYLDNIEISAKWTTITIDIDLSIITCEDQLDTTYQITATITPSGSSSVSFASSNEEAFTVDQTGLVRCVGLGRAVIRATIDDGGDYVECECISVNKIVSNGNIVLFITIDENTETTFAVLCSTTDTIKQVSDKFLEYKGIANNYVDRTDRGVEVDSSLAVVDAFYDLNTLDINLVYNAHIKTNSIVTYRLSSTSAEYNTPIYLYDIVAKDGYKTGAIVAYDSNGNQVAAYQDTKSVIMPSSDITIDVLIKEVNVSAKGVKNVVIDSDIGFSAQTSVSVGAIKTSAYNKDIKFNTTTKQAVYAMHVEFKEGEDVVDYNQEYTITMKVPDEFINKDGIQALYISNGVIFVKQVEIEGNMARITLAGSGDIVFTANTHASTVYLYWLVILLLFLDTFLGMILLIMFINYQDALQRRRELNAYSTLMPALLLGAVIGGELAFVIFLGIVLIVELIGIGWLGLKLTNKYFMYTTYHKLAAPRKREYQDVVNDYKDKENQQ